MPQVKIIAKNFMDMVASLTARDLNKLYENPFICEAILRSLPPLAKKYVFQMLYIDGAIPAKTMEEWVLPDGFTKHKVAIDRLVQLRLFSEEKKKETTYRLNSTFQSNLQKHLINGGALPREPMPSGITARLPTLEDLEAYAIGQWECFLLQLISSAQAERPTNFSSSMMKVFQRGLLIQRDKEAPRLTESGFQFLRIYLQFPGVASDILFSGFSASKFLRVPVFDSLAYNLNTLSEIQRSMIKDFADLGLVKLQQGRKESWFIPTKLATNLSMSLTDSSARKEGFVVVETNFRMYAYSTSKLHCEILRLFSKIEYQLPNLIVGAITKESLYNAFENGITAEQIRLWESDLNRVEMTPAHYYEEFPSRDVFEAACDYARDRSGLLWEDSKKMRLVVNAEIHMHMREFLRGQNK
ncbi:General transcription and DNA repair factor IIH subunit TFB2 [Citrus sinensis]|uniref:General transcription and DNA repair factor IIH subunit TFB2 n=1 Tax=Citrus sinensis TaxID=2711 RepID=A0ACB8NR42_CITSI|nr:General transcription and DNA repair factor IIH subunit TFB2 [Citrus sinensis]KAH9800611.1 General transcription and DNA repair factor IIH subunit TFB2 [Citrus sinensis]